MGNLFCPNIKDADYLEMVAAFRGNEAQAHGLWNNNKGNPVYKDHKGNPSLLWEDLLAYTEGDRLEAIRLKSIVFNHAFKDRFGNWLEIDYTPETNNVYENGEPQMDNILDTEVMRNKKPGHMDPEIGAIIEKYNKKGVDGEALITDNNNPYSWKIENELGLISHFTKEPGEILKTKHYKGFTDAEARVLIDKVRKLGGWGYFIPLTNDLYGVGVGYKIGRPVRKAAGKTNNGGIVTLAGIEFISNERDSRKLRTAVNQMVDGNLDALSNLSRMMGFFASEFNSQPEVKATANLFLSNKSKASNIIVKVEDRNDSGDYMEYDPEINTITIFSEAVMNQPTAKGFVASFVHEIGHAFLTRAIVSPQNNTDRQFKDTMSKIYSDVKLHSVLNGSSNYYGLKDVHEFMVTFLNDPKFASDLKRYNAPRTFYQRVVDAIVQFFYRFVGYQLKKEKGTDLHDYVQKTITNYINKRSSYYSSQSYKEGAAYQKHKAEVRQSYEDIKRTLDPSKPDPAKTVKALEKLEELFSIKRTKDEHSYKEKASGVYFQSVTEFMAAAGLGVTKKDIEKMTPTRLANFTRSGNLGTAIHLTLQGKTKKITENILKETGFVMTADASYMISKVLDTIRKTKGLEGKDVTVLSEVFICDPYKQTGEGVGVAGSIDLVIIDPNGRVHIFDFKTKEVYQRSDGQQSKDSNWRYYSNKNASGYSELERDRTQLALYKHMFEKTLGIPVASMNVVMLNATVTKDEVDDAVYQNIGSVSIDTTISQNGMDTSSSQTVSQWTRLVRKIYGERPLKFNWSTLEEGLVEDADYKNTIEYKLKTINAGKLSDVDKIYRDTIKILEDKLEVIRKRYAYSRYREFEEFVDKVSQESSTSAALSAIIIYAAEVTKKYVDRYQLMIKRGDIFTPQLLMEWRDYITSYDSLNRLSILLKENPSLLNEPKIINLLNGEDGVVHNLNVLKEVFEKQGKVTIAKKLAPYYNGFKIRRKEELEKKYRRLAYRFENKVSEDEKIKSDVYGAYETLTKKELDMFLAGTTMEDYVNANLLIEKDAIEKLTYEMLLRELSVASSDVNEATRWIDTLEDTSDPVVSAMLSEFTKQDEKQRLEALKKRLEVVRLLRKVEDLKGKTSFTSERDMWKAILEEYNGELTNHLIRPWLSLLDVEEKAVRKANRTKTDKKARDDMKAWTKDNFPLLRKEEGGFEDEYYMAFRSYLSQMVQLNEMKPEEMEAIMRNETDPSPKPITALSEWTADPFSESDKKVVPPEISDDAADIALAWRTRNRKLYATVNKKWVNPQWAAFAKEVGVRTDIPIALQMTEMEKSENPMAQMYILLTKLAESADSSLPYHYRLGYRLPGISKTKNERLREGQNLKTMIKETASVSFMKRAEDTLYQDSKEFTDEHGNPKYFLPIHFTAKLGTDQQSYDLPTIYYKYWCMANDYHHKKEILPQLEMTKYFVQNRKTERHTWFGEKMMRAARSGRPTTDEDVSLSNVNRMSAMLEDWFQSYVYGNTVTESKFKVGSYVFDGQKLTSSLMGFVSLNLLAFNVVQANANVAVGEAMTAIDAIAGEWFNPASLTYATKLWLKWLPGMSADLGSRSPSHVGTLLGERFNVMSDDIVGGADFSNSTKMKGMLRSSAVSILQIGGEHWLRHRPLFAMLKDVRAIDKDGKYVGPMVEQYYSDNGELKIRDNIDLKASKWEEEDQLRFYREFHGRMANVNGNYGSMERVAAQRYVIGALAYMYRKYIMPGIKRRYRKMEYIERMQQSMEGNYRTTAKFFSRLAREMHGMQLAVMGEEWAALSPHEKANIKRTLAEVGTLIATITLAHYAYTSWSDTDDPDEARFWAFIAYQAYRLKAELLFYSPKLDETMSLLRSPMASMSLMENTIKLTDQLFAPFEVYERGPWKGHLKLERDVVQFIPIYKQYYKFRDIEEQIQWFR